MIQLLSMDFLSKRILFFLIIVFFCFSVILAPIPTFAMIPFGGPIIEATFCDEGIWIVSGPPNPGSFMYIYGTPFFPFGPPTHSGQFLLGLATGFSECTVGPEVVGGGMVMYLFGSSL